MQYKINEEVKILPKECPLVMLLKGLDVTSVDVCVFILPKGLEKIVPGCCGGFEPRSAKVFLKPKMIT